MNIDNPGEPDSAMYKTLLEPTKALGVGTRTVTPGSHSLVFVEAVDKLPYQAKRNGRMWAEFDVWVEE